MKEVLVSEYLDGRLICDVFRSRLWGLHKEDSYENLMNSRPVTWTRKGEIYVPLPKLNDDMYNSYNMILSMESLKKLHRFPLFIDMEENPKANNAFGVDIKGVYPIDSVMYDGVNLNLNIDSRMSLLLGTTILTEDKTIEIPIEDVSKLERQLQKAVRPKMLR